MKAATQPSRADQLAELISIHAAREGGDILTIARRFNPFISIHAAREGGDIGIKRQYYTYAVFQSTPPVKAATMLAGFAASWDVFQSTPPVKAATQTRDIRAECADISIHAAREGGDCGNE